ncbi:type II secretion system F family protein [bacterium]|nr:type II secretion system F family protein [bacterium]
MKFFYKARLKEGRLQTGVVEASSKKDALAILEKHGFYVTSLQAEREISLLKKNIVLRKKVSLKDIVFFTRQLAVMLEAGIPTNEALTAQVAQIENPVFSEKVMETARAVKAGAMLSQGFSLHPKVFNNFYTSVIRSGEATGKVADSLSYLADHLEREYELRRKIISAMTYPAFIIGVLIAVVFLASFFIIPKLVDVLKSFNTKLPYSTKILVSMSDFIQRGGWVPIILFFVLIILTPFALKRTPQTSGFYDRTILKMPIIGEFTKKIQIVRMSENISILISSGLPITQALSITKNILSNSVYKDILDHAEKEVARGEKLSDVFARYPGQIPPFVWQMASTGEEAGKLDQMLLKVVEFYRKEIERTTESLSSIIEPILIVFIGVVVGAMAISIFIPLFGAGFSGM